MEALISLIQKYNEGQTDACDEILRRMSPLVRKYAGKIHCMEYEDALQELYIAVIESLKYLNPEHSEGKCVKYMETAVINRYYALCKRYLSMPETEDIENSAASLSAPSAYDESYLDITAYIQTLPEAGNKREILSLYFYENLEDKEIAEHLGISRQYVNRIKKQLIRAYYDRSSAT